ncbi:predicted protein [Naegleria gruberi]|uniref:H(+)-exporting diphosphatase n=1 Tax=Naegleria gruberi TaxID=5762 RepID=D2VM87_NAEGR|nr:uncharacterized protein NAEGRDRAFT_70050 [Naegleria gruberi]EFC42019.1 predicted protein [Naegleria gruberi]|eukprot:XP_002674763.1 predicted protein [Naegleria gruberi strain NEG-M]
MEAVTLEASTKYSKSLVVQVLGELGNPVPNVTVYFYATPKSNYKMKPYFSPSIAKSGIDGRVFTSLTAGNTPGVGSISASLNSKLKYTNDTTAVSFSYTVTAPVYGEAWGQISFVIVSCLLSMVGAFFIAVYVMRKNRGTSAMIAVADPIKEGASGFLKTQYLAIGGITIPVAFLLFGLYLLRSKSSTDPDIHIAAIAAIVTISFLIGVLFSGLSGFVGMFVSVNANSRVTNAATRSYREALNIAMRSGAFVGFLVVSLSVLGVIVLFSILYLAIPKEMITPTQIVGMIVGFSFGCSLSALFAQLGGGIFTKAADVGADLVGKVEQNIPEDDIRNPAVIADLVGDNVGDCAGRGSDLFESISAENIGVMILAGTLTSNAFPQISTPLSYIIFPLVVHVCGMIGTWVGMFFVRVRDVTEMGSAGDDSYSLIRNTELSETTLMENEENEESSIRQEFLDDPMKALNRGFYVSVLVTTCLFVVCSYWLLRSDVYPNAWWKFMLCGLIGVLTSFAFVFITIYYTDFNWRPVKEIIESSKSGPATNIISGIAVGLESTGAPVFVICVAILSSYYLGKSSGITDENGLPIGGLFGTAVATIGMLSSSSYILAMDTLGPIVDNAGGIAEMSQLPANVRMITDRLDAVGNTTKALTKGYAIGSAALAAFLLFSAFLDTVEAYIGTSFKVVNLAVPEVFVGGLIGACLVFVFSSLTMRAVGTTAQTVIEEVRKQFQEMPGILEFREKPNYERCVAIVTRASLIQMIFPGLLSVLVPVLVGFIFKGVGAAVGQPNLGAEVSAGFLMVATITCILMALFFNNAGGAWDNAKKLTEMDKVLGGKGSAIHKAAVIGDTIGDPFKDTTGPSIHVLCKLLATITLVVGPLYLNYTGTNLFNTTTTA